MAKRGRSRRIWEESTTTIEHIEFNKKERRLQESKV
jgi:hypothetical protein